MGGDTQLPTNENEIVVVGGEEGDTEFESRRSHRTANSVESGSRMACLPTSYHRLVTVESPCQLGLGQSGPLPRFQYE